MSGNHGLSIPHALRAALVLGASKFALPVSTTHVAIGAIVGAGSATLDLATLRNVVLAWVATMPLAAAIAWSVSLLS